MADALPACPFCGCAPVRDEKLVACGTTGCGIHALWMTPREWRRRVPMRPVAWAVVSDRNKVHKMAIKQDSAERKATRWRATFPHNTCRVVPLVIGADAHPTQEE